MNKEVVCIWRKENPKDIWIGQVRFKSGVTGYAMYDGGRWLNPTVGSNDPLNITEDVLEWLDVTEEQVQLRILEREAEIWDDLVESCREMVSYSGDLASKMAGRTILDQMRHIKPKKVKK